ncbi:MAG TPA: 2,3-diaminopropionate biosynthesis protein SbnA [Blastocatellia bacterium]|jgi:cysteine synthase A|nr:2,3-diaminopropionate biosynthesis protein SbnA [Blastocatellia bacterium]
MDEGILSAIGSTPLVRLTKVMRDISFRLYAKLESLNPGGSMKDRPALEIINHGIRTGAIGPDTVVVESSSGNMGIGLAQACCYYGLRFICVVDPKTASQNISLLRAYGARIDLVEKPDPVTGEFLKARLDRVRYLVGKIEGSYWPNQYENLYNPIGHYHTMEEISAALGEVDFLFCATSTCGTMRGCAEYVRDHDLKTRIVAVDAIGSVIFGGKSAKRLIPGHGAALRPQLFQPGLAYNYIHVSDLDCVVGCRRLALSEAILAGGSSGAVLTAIEQIRHEIPAEAACVAIFADRGERYLDTIYSDEWVSEHFGDVAHLWADSVKATTWALATY